MSFPSHPLAPFSTPAEIVAEPPQRWLISKLLPESGFVQLLGETSVGKTFLALDMSLAVARGIPWFGRRTRRKLVVYVSYEDPLQERVAAYFAHHALQPSDVNTFYRYNSTVDLFDDMSRATFIKHCRALVNNSGAIGLIVIDTLNRAAPGGEENSSADMGRIIHACLLLRNTFDCCVLVVHHEGKDASKGSRGHSSLPGALDTAFRITRDGDQMYTLEVKKQRRGKDGDAFTFERLVVPLAADEEGEEINSCVIREAANRPRPARKLGVNQQVLINHLRNAPWGIQRDALRNLCREEIGTSNPSACFAAALDALVIAGLVVEMGGAVFIEPTVTK